MYPYDWVRERNLKHNKLRGERHIFKHLDLKCSDPGKLLWLMSILFDRCVVPMEVKINEYLQSVTKSCLGFFAHFSAATSEVVIVVIGLKELAPEVSISSKDRFWEKIESAGKCPVLISKIEYFPVLLREEIITALNEYGEIFDVCTLYPVFLKSPHLDATPTPSFYYGLINYEKKPESISTNYGFINECFRYCGSSVVATFAYNEEMYHVQNCKAIIEACLEIIPYIDDLKMFWQTLKDEISLLMKAEGSFAYFLKHINPYHSTVIDFERPALCNVSDIYPYQIGLEGKMLRQGKLINTNNPENELLFGHFLNKFNTMNIRNILAFPLIHNSVTNGVVEVFNKMDNKLFSKVDEDYAKCIGSLGGEFLEQAMKFVLSKYDHDRFTQINCINLRRINDETPEAVERVLYCPSSHNYHHMYEFKFLPSIVPEKHTVCILMGLYYELGITTKFEINEYKLISFLQTIESSHPKMPFHNWGHAFTSAHFIFLLMRNLSLIQNKFIDVVEAFALLTAVICQGVDYRGPTTQFQMTTGTSLPSLYGSPGCINARFAVAQVLQIICKPKCNMTDNMPEEQFQVFIYLLEEMIIALDMSSYRRKLDLISIMVDTKCDTTNIDHKKLLFSLLLNAAQLSDFVKSKNHCAVTCERLFEEFFRSDSTPTAHGVYEMSDLTDTPIKILALKTQFMEMIVVPTFEMLNHLFPTTYKCYTHVLEYFNVWNEEFSKIDKATGKVTPTDSVVSSLSSDSSADDMIFK